MALLVWMWITNSALLLGVELNAEREHSRQFAVRMAHAEREIELEPRSQPKPKRTA